MGFLSNLVKTALPVAGGVFGGPGGMALGGLAAGMLSGTQNPYSAPNIYGTYNQLSPQVQALINQLQQGGLDTRPYDALRRNTESNAFSTAKQMNQILNQNMASRGLSNSTIRTSKNADVYSQALSDMASRMAQIDAQQAQAQNADRYNRTTTGINSLLSLLRGGSGLDQQNALNLMNAQRLNYGAQSDQAGMVSGLGALAGQLGGLDWLRSLLSGGRSSFQMGGLDALSGFGGTP